MKTFLNGLGLILPTALVLYILIWILKTTENFFGEVILFVLPKQYYITGLGLIAGIMIVFLVGLLLKFWIVQKIRDFFETLIDKMPLVNTLYGAIKDFFNFFSNLKNKENDIVVLVSLGALDAKIMGFITSRDLERFKFLDMEEPVVVYFQMSYQVGGYSLFIPKKNITFIDIKTEDALGFIMTAGISSSRKYDKKENKNEQS
ncbi:DUF502 domain-containing protein [Sulfurimonas sp. CVO]|jgi:uncharacterized membrane protein|uniref:DUF502 domain-containing protein n=1 Tax=Sulfurimonas xiamenensis TaxID=2590021 RepID=A0AAJ4DMX5_9BACT|nr:MULTISPECIES: DUF502 domain-containing protein [Sulfurimonas]QFR43510.1 DUF502 domain-containing protein [Sulfurimonas xiamenensis]QHG90924.1 DUF502 domain-containing protein [Sulfurimonas sp. CVO]